MHIYRVRICFINKKTGYYNNAKFSLYNGISLRLIAFVDMFFNNLDLSNKAIMLTESKWKKLVMRKDKRIRFQYT